MSQNGCDCAGVGRTQGCALCRPDIEVGIQTAMKDPKVDVVTLIGAKEHDKLRHIREAANELCHALAERWFEPGDTEAQTARAVAAHKRLSDLLMMEGGGE